MSPSDSHRWPLHHEALLYRGQGELGDAVAGFVREAADAGEPVLVAVPSENLHYLAATLGDAAAGVQFRDMADVGRNPACLLPMMQDWIAERGTGARMVSEPMWSGRSYAETTECLRHEALINYALVGSGAHVLCPYDAESLDAVVIEGAELTHPQVRDASGSRASVRFADPAVVARGDQWALSDPVEPISEHVFAGDLRFLRRAVAGDPLLAALSDGRRDDLVFAINEAATNVLRHGDGHCTTRIWHDGTSVVSEVSSDGEVADILAGRRRPATDSSSGRGLWLINQLCDLVELRSGRAGTILRMHVR